MTVNYTTNLALGQPVTGTESGTWGDDVNNSVTSYLDIAIAGGLAITITTTDVTLSLTQGTSSATNIGSTTAQYAILNVSGAMTAARNLILPSSSRQYVINNNTTGGFALTVKGAATTGVTMVNGESSHIYWNGSDYAKLSNAPGGAGTFTNLTYTGTLTGSTGVIAIGTNQIYKDSSGNVGIGTSSPSYKLDVRGVIAGGNGTIIGGISYSTRPEIGAISNHPVGFITNNTTQMLIDTSGNVGIGTSSPSYKLDVVGGIRVTLSGQTQLWNGATGVYTSYQYNGTTNGDIGTANQTFSGGATGDFGITSRAGNLVLGTNTTERMRIDSSGNVGIGTTSPAEKLNVVGGNIKTDASSRQIGYWEADTIHDGYFIGYNSSGQSELVNSYATGGILFKTGNSKTERMRINSSGYVGIGASTTAQLRSQLTVLGAGQATAALQDSGNTDGTIQINSNVNAGGRGGALTFGALLDNSTYTPFVAIKGLLASGANNGLGSLAFSYRALNTDSTLTEGMRLNYDGNVGIGTSSPSYKLDVVGITRISNGGDTYVGFGANKDNYWTTGTTSGKQVWRNSAGSEFMQIDSSGNVLVGSTSQFNFGKQCIAFNGTTNYGISAKDTVDQAAARFIGFINGSGTVIGSVDRVTTTNAVVYNTTSDYRLKTVTGTVTGQGARIDALKPIDYLWTEGGQQARGFLAHEFQEVYSNSVTGEKDAVDADGNPKYQAMQAGSSEVIADLVAEIQSLRKRLAALEAR